LIKKTSFEDLSAIEYLEKLCFPNENWNLAQITSHHKIHNSLLFLSDSTNDPAGYLLYSETSFEFEILRLGVLSQLRREGIAEMLLDYLEKLAEKREIILEVNCENFPAIELYKKKGFINYAVRKRYYPNGKDAILMKREVL
jgi:[ribosomal protein S18]-alanine N-acetyltransferase